MKTLQEIINSTPVFLNDWSSEDQVYKNFAGYDNEYKIDKEGKKILFASYGYENYSGDAFVLFEENGELYEVNGGHCSCYGLEGQWTPSLASLEELKYRLTEGTMGESDYSGNQFATELKEFLGIECTT